MYCIAQLRADCRTRLGAREGGPVDAVEIATLELRDADEALTLIPATTLALDVLRGAFRRIAKKQVDSAIASTEGSCSLPDEVRKTTT